MRVRHQHVAIDLPPNQADFLPRELFKPVPAASVRLPEPPLPTLADMQARRRRVDIELPVGDMPRRR